MSGERYKLQRLGTRRTVQKLGSGVTVMCRALHDRMSQVGRMIEVARPAVPRCLRDVHDRAHSACHSSHAHNPAQARLNRTAVVSSHSPFFPFAAAAPALENDPCRRMCAARGSACAEDRPGSTPSAITLTDGAPPASAGCDAAACRRAKKAAAPLELLFRGMPDVVVVLDGAELGFDTGRGGPALCTPPRGGSMMSPNVPRMLDISRLPVDGAHWPRADAGRQALNTFIEASVLAPEPAAPACPQSAAAHDA